MAMTTIEYIHLVNYGVYLMKPKSKKLLLMSMFLVALLWITGCDQNQSKITYFDSKLQTIKDKYAPDPSLDVCHAEMVKEEDSWIVRGETTFPEAKYEILTLADSLLGNNQYQSELLLLPHSELGDSTYGIIKISVANIREEPRHSAQLLDQNIMGQTILLLKNKRGWYFVQTEYGYLGWMTNDSFVRTDSVGIVQWRNIANVRVSSMFPIIYSKPDENSEPVTDVVMNAMLHLEKKGREWVRVVTPDGRGGYIRSTFIDNILLKKHNTVQLRKSIVKTARSMMGLPYLWGGNSTKGNDCSGYTQTTFRANGIELPRDSRQQALVGEAIIPDDKYSNILAGDLLFFGAKNRVTHVGISLGGSEFIHQGGQVAVNSLDPEAENFSPYRRKTLKYIKRIF
jgi:hypothetical protein